VSNLIRDDWPKVPMHDWNRLGAIVEDKQEYLDSAAATIDSNTFKNTKAKTEKEREVKFICKIRKAKKVLQKKICYFRELINATLANTLNCKKEVPIQ